MMVPSYFKEKINRLILIIRIVKSNNKTRLMLITKKSNKNNNKLVLKIKIKIQRFKINAKDFLFYWEVMNLYSEIVLFS